MPKINKYQAKVFIVIELLRYLENGQKENFTNTLDNILDSINDDNLTYILKNMKE